MAESVNKSGVMRPETRTQELEIVHPTFPHNFSVQVKSGACYITGQWGSAQNKKNKPNPNTNRLLFFIIKFVFLSWFLRLYHFYRLFTGYFLRKGNVS